MRARLALIAAISALLAGLVVCSSSLAATTPRPAWELLSTHGPTNVPLKESVNQVMTLTFHANVGKFYLEFENEETAEEGETRLLPYDASASEVQKALERLKHGEPKTAIGEGNVNVSGGYDAATETGTYVIEFVGAMGGRYLGEALSLSSEITEHEETKFEKEEEQSGRGREPEEPEGEAAITTGGYHDSVIYQLILANRGAVPATAGGEHPIVLRDTLPAGATTKEAPHGEGWSCKNGEPETEKEQREEAKRLKEEKLPEGAGLKQIECVLSHEVAPDAPAPTVTIEAYLDTSALQGMPSIENQAKIEGGGAEPASARETAPLDSAPAQFGLQRFIASDTGVDGAPYTQAGGHPYAATTGLFFNTVPHVNPELDTEVAVAGRLKDADVKLPAGFIGNPLATERCSQAVFTEGVPGGPHPKETCGPRSQVGMATVYINHFGASPTPARIFNLVPPAGVPAEFGFIFANLPVRLDAHVVRETSGGNEYRVTVLSADVNEALGVFAIQVTLWGEPADASHNAQRGGPYEGAAKPFLTNPLDCLGEAEALEPGTDTALAPVTHLAADSWEQQGALDASGQPQLPGPNWAEAEAASPPVTGCDALNFAPAISFVPRFDPSAGVEEVEGEVQAGTTQADSPSGYRFELNLPQHEEPGELATPELRNTSVTLPEGISVSPSAASGLQACSVNEINLTSTARGECPEASQIGTVTVVSALLEKPLEGRVYVAEPECSPCGPEQVAHGEMLKLYIEVEGSGVRVKLSGTAFVDQSSGQITTTFDNNPQLPFEKLILKLKGGQRAALMNAQVCGESLAASGLLTPWSLGGATSGGQEVLGTPPPSAILSSPFVLTGCPASMPFNPGFQAGTQSSTAGAYTNFDVTFSRKDGEQDLSGVTVQTPPGLLGKIAGIPRCGGVAAESATVECPAASQIGSAESAAGAGTQPYVVTGGRVYLTGGYKGAPFGLKVAVPAIAGPFNLGTVVVRAAITIDPKTSAITVTSDPLPQSIDGLPFRLKTVKVDVNRPGFMFNPTNCETQAVTAKLSGLPAGSGEPAVSVERSAPFTASSCAALSFAPTFLATTQAETSKANGASLTVKVAQRRGEANIHKVEVELPEALPSRLPTLQKACTEKQFAENPAGCPEASDVGTATAHTPLLDAPLTGPAYLVSHGGAAFPDLVFLLQGEGVHIELVGKTDIKKIGGKEITFSRFETVPDAPVDSFETSFPEGPHSILDAYGDLCETPLYAPTTIVGQNNAQFTQNTVIAVTGCPPTLKIAGVKIKKGKVLLKLTLSQAGTVAVSGKGIASVRRSMRAGTQQLVVALTKAGKKAAKHHKKLVLKASLTAGSRTSSTKTASVKG